MAQRTAQFILRIIKKEGRPVWLGAILIAILLALPLIILVLIAAMLLPGTQPMRATKGVSVPFLTSGADEQISHLLDVEAIFSDRVAFRQRVAAKNWSELFSYTSNPVFDTSVQPYISHMIVTNTSGTLVAAAQSTSNSIGKDFSYRDWFNGRSSDSGGYVSSAYQTIQSSPYTVIGISYPVFDPLYQNQVNGYLVFQIKNTYFLDWITSLQLDPADALYVIDQKGQIIASTNSHSGGTVISIANAPVVQKVLSGASGEEKVPDPLGDGMRDAIYAPIQPYGWGIILEQPVTVAPLKLSAWELWLALMALFAAYSLFLAVVLLKVVALQNYS